MIEPLIRSEDLNSAIRAVLGVRRWRPEESFDEAAPPYEKVFSLLALAALILAHVGHSPDDRDGHVSEPQKAFAHLWHNPYVKIFRGPHVPKRVSEITIRDPFTWKQTDERIGVVATGTRIADVLAGALTLEWEGLYADHWGTDDFHEMGAAIYARWNRFPWNDYIRTTFAIGVGPSITSKPAHYEPKKGTRSRWLMQLNFEINVYSPSKPDWALLFRIQHRSGMYKLINNVRGGSNFLVVGLRRNFGDLP